MFTNFRASRLQHRRRQALGDVRSERAGFEAAMIRAEAAGIPATSALAERVRSQFADIEGAVGAAGDDDITALVERAEALGQLSSYVCPDAEILVEGEEAVNTLEQWGVPAVVIAGFRSSLLPKLSSGDPGVPRAALRALFEQYDAWSRYVDDHHHEMLLTFRLLLLSIAALTLLAGVILGSSPESVTGAGAPRSSGRYSRCTSRASDSHTPDG